MEKRYIEIWRGTRDYCAVDQENVNLIAVRLLFKYLAMVSNDCILSKSQSSPPVLVLQHLCFVCFNRALNYWFIQASAEA